MDETLKMKRDRVKASHRCLFCGASPEPPDVLLQGVNGGICRGCVYALAARLAETERDTGDVGDATGMLVIEPDTASDGDGRSAHDYQTRMDLAAAYLEMGKKIAAVSELLLATESAILCGDFSAAMRCAARAREIGDGPTLRDRLAEIFTRNAPPET